MKGQVAPLIKEYYPQYFSIESYPSSQCAPFCKVRDQWGIFSNFAQTPIDVDGMSFNCVEKLFQCLKFRSADAIREIYESNGQTIKMKAKKWSRTDALRPDWGSMIVDAMKFCLHMKYSQSAEFKNALSNSKGLYIVEDQTTFQKKSADTWGCKLHENYYVGPNLMGRLLMELRDSDSFTYIAPETALSELKEMISSI